VNQGSAELKGGILGFQVIVGGNVDYWGLLLGKGKSVSVDKRIFPAGRGGYRPCGGGTVPGTVNSINPAANTWVTGTTGIKSQHAEVTYGEGLVRWANPQEVVTTYFKTSKQMKKVQIELTGKGYGKMSLRVSFGGETRTI